MRERAAIALALVALLAAGCGGGDEEAAETLPAAPELTVPGETAPELDDEGGELDTSTSDDATAPAPAPAPQPPAGGGGTPDQGGGQSPPSGGQPAPQDTPENDTPPPPGSPAERFEQFCAENPGAC